MGKVGMNETTTADVSGQVSYNLDRISSLLQPLFPADPAKPGVGGRIRLSGRGTGLATWHGPLALDRCQAATELKWDNVYLYGFELGSATIKPKLEGGVLSIDPLQVPVAQGKVFLAPKVRLAPEPMVLTLPPGPLVQQVQISPTCARRSSSTSCRCWPTWPTPAAHFRRTDELPAAA